MTPPWWSPPGEISPNGQWVWIHRCWMYNSDTLVGLLRQILTEYQHDRHLVG